VHPDYNRGRIDSELALGQTQKIREGILT